MGLVVAHLGREENRGERRDSLLPSLLEWTDRGFPRQRHALPSLTRVHVQRRSFTADSEFFRPPADPTGGPTSPATPARRCHALIRFIRYR